MSLIKSDEPVSVSLIARSEMNYNFTGITSTNCFYKFIRIMVNQDFFLTHQIII